MGASSMARNGLLADLAIVIAWLLVAATWAGADSPIPVHQARDAVRRGDASALLELVRERYRALDTLAVTGESVVRMTMGGRKTVQTTRYVARASRSGTYLVRWDAPTMTIDHVTAPAAQAGESGAVWNDGTGAFNYYAAEPGAWAKATSDEVAIAMATGVSGGATETLLLFRGAIDASVLGIEPPSWKRRKTSTEPRAGSCPVRRRCRREPSCGSRARSSWSVEAAGLSPRRRADQLRSSRDRSTRPCSSSA